jgi:hypothetical protein
MAVLRCTIAVASLGFLLGGGANALAQQSTAPSSDQAPASGASGRGVRILPAEAPPATPVANPQQGKAPAANAVTARPAPAAAPGVRPAAPPVLKSCDRPNARPALRFAEPEGFDTTLRAALRRGRPVVVDLATPYPADREAPAPLGAWLNEVKQSGGIVSMAPYCQKGRGLGGFFAKLFGGGPAEPYKAARRYDAVLHVDAVDQAVTQIEFAPRKGAK